MDGTRVIFDFDNPNFENLKRMTRDCGFETMGATLHAAIHLVDEIQRHGVDGCTEVILRNPRSGSSHRLQVDPRTLQKVH